MNASRQAELAGIDLSLIDESLRLTPEQRAIQHQAALNLALELERAGRELRERAQQAPQPTVGRDKDRLAAKELRAIVERR